MAQRMIGYAQARRSPSADNFRRSSARSRMRKAQALDAGQPYPLLSGAILARAGRGDGQRLGPPSDWIVEWKFDGIRAQLLKRGEVGGSGRAARS